MSFQTRNALTLKEMESAITIMISDNLKMIANNTLISGNSLRDMIPQNHTEIIFKSLIKIRSQNKSLQYKKSRKNTQLKERANSPAGMVQSAFILKREHANTIMRMM